MTEPKQGQDVGQRVNVWNYIYISWTNIKVTGATLESSVMSDCSQ